MNNIMIIARKEIQEGMRNRWVVATTLLLAALALTLSFLGSVPTGNVGASRLDIVVVSLSSLAVVTSLAFDAQWGPPLPALALILAMSAALVALTALVIAVSRTERQADGIATIITFTLLLLGGNFVLISQAP